MSAFNDPYSIAGKLPEIAEHAPLLVIGAGEAGMNGSPRRHRSRGRRRHP